MQNPDNLEVSSQARRVVVAVYDLTRSFPADERYGLTSQMRRAAVSICSNIAEGCGRFGDRQLAAFLQIALGSASELEMQLKIATDLRLVSNEGASPTLHEISRAKRMLARLIKALRGANSLNR